MLLEEEEEVVAVSAALWPGFGLQARGATHTPSAVSAGGVGGW